MHPTHDKLNSSRSSPNGDWFIVLRVVAIFLMGLAFGVGGAIAYRSYADADERRPTSGEPIATAANPPSSSASRPRRSVVALGTLEPRDGIVQISSALVGYQVKQVRVKDGQLVQLGDVLVELDAGAAEAEHQLALSQLAEALERQQAEIALAKQRVASAQLAVEQATDGRPLELDAQQSRISVAAAKKKQAEKDVERVEGLRKLSEPLTSDQQVEQQALVLEGAAAELEAAQVALKRLEQVLTFQQQSAAAELRAAQQSLAVAEKGTGVESLKHRVELADLKRKQTKLTAPTAGVVLGVMTHAGEVVAQQPLLQIADLDNLICEAEVDAGDVPHLQANQKATVSCRAFQDSVLEGSVDRVGNQVTQATLRPLDPRKPVDRDVTKVVVLIDSKKAARLINMSGKDRRAALVGLQVEVAFPLAKAAP
jgi:ABC exporter DevB family membrane fusion protein